MSPFLFPDVFYLYIIYSSRSDKFYTGITSDINRRLEEHNDPSRFNKYTAKHIPWEMRLVFEVSDKRGDALKVERFIKNQKSRVFIEKLIDEQNNPEYFKSLIENVLNK